MALAGPDGKATLFDEDDQIVHSLQNGVLTMATNFVDYTTYILTQVGQGPDSTFDVQVTRLDDYHRHEKAQTIVCDFDEDDEEDLATRLDSLVDQMDMADEAQPPTPDDTATLKSMMIDAGEWEWTAWSQIGTYDIQAALDKHDIAISLKEPTEKEARRVFASDDFSDGLLAWFRTQLNPQGWTLVAVAPFDELQQFALVRSENLETVRALLRKQACKIR